MIRLQTYFYNTELRIAINVSGIHVRVDEYIFAHSSIASHGVVNVVIVYLYTYSLHVLMCNCVLVC